MSHLSEVLGTLPGNDAPQLPDDDMGDASDEPAACGRTARFLAKFVKLNSALCEVVQDYGMVAYVPLAVEVRVSVPCSQGVR